MRAPDRRPTTRPLGIACQAADPAGVTTTYGYARRLPRRVSPVGSAPGSVTLTLDPERPSRHRRRSVVGDSLALTYDPAGLLTGVGGLALTRDPAGTDRPDDPGGRPTVQQYDATDQLVRSTTTVSGKVVDDVRYTRDALGRIATVAETTPTGTTTTAYAYDAADRLASVTVNSATTETDTYDAAGNRTSVKAPSGTTTATFDDRDRLKTDGSETFTWADDGELAKRTDSSGTTAFTFDDLGTLRGVTLADGRSITYVVDADGRRIGRQVGGKLVAGYLYDPAGTSLRRRTAPAPS